MGVHSANAAGEMVVCFAWLAHHRWTAIRGEEGFHAGCESWDKRIRRRTAQQGVMNVAPAFTDGAVRDDPEVDMTDETTVSRHELFEELAKQRQEIAVQAERIAVLESRLERMCSGAFVEKQRGGGVSHRRSDR